MNTAAAMDGERPAAKHQFMLLSKYIKRVSPQPGSVMVFVEFLHSSSAGLTSTISVVTSLELLVLMQSGGTSRFLPSRGLTFIKPFTSVR